MNKDELKIITILSIRIKNRKSKLRIIEFIEQLGEENCYVSFSGGKDSTVLLHLVRSLYPNIKAVFSDTGLEFPEIKDFVKSFENTLFENIDNILVKIKNELKKWRCNNVKLFIK